MKHLRRVWGLLWALPCSVVGMVLATVPLLAGGQARWSAGALEVTYRETESGCGRLANGLAFRGIVFGHVILAVTRDELLQFYEGKTAKWQIPDDVVFVDAIPLGATGKMLKVRLREQLHDYVLPTA